MTRVRKDEELEDKIRIGHALNLFAILAVSAGEMEKAARLWEAGQVIHDTTGYELNRVDREFIDRYITRARGVMGDEAFAAAFRKGHSMRLKNAIALARETG